MMIIIQKVGAPAMLELLQFRYSPYNEKVRWALDLKRVPHRRESLLPGPHMGRVRKLTGRTMTPVLLSDSGAIDGSTRIVEWLDARHPEPRLVPASNAERAEALALVQYFDDDIAPRGRRAVLQALLTSPRYFARVFADGKPAWMQLGYAAIVPLAAPLVRKGNGISGEAAVSDGLAAFEQGLNLVAERAQRGAGYLVGGAFGIADLTAASVLAVCVDPPDSPMTRPLPRAPAFAALVARYAEHPGAAWVRRIYSRHRGARRDFDGEGPDA
jgi:glutathione S-transferase